MKKNIILVIVLLLTVLNPVVIFAQTKSTVTPTSKPSTTVADKEKTDSLTEQISELKEKIASRVAQLKLVDKRGIIGIVSDVSDTQVTLKSADGTLRYVDVDEITKFSSPSEKESFGISDIAKGSKVSAIGLYNKQSKRILARFVEVMNMPIILNGTIAEVNGTDFTVRIITEDQKDLLVDIEKVTKTSSYTKADGVTKIGFTKLETGTHALVVGFPDKKERNRVVATRILIFPDLPPNPKIVIPDKLLNSSDEVTPSTGSGKKITPLR